MESLKHLAKLIKTRTDVASQIGTLIGRPAQIGHVGEYIASRVFSITLNISASQKGMDGHFNSGPLKGKSVDIKWTTKHDGLLNLREDDLPDYYLVLAGPKTGAMPSRGQLRPWVIEFVYLFAAQPLVQRLRAKGIKIGVATSVRRHYWDAAEVYPSARNQDLTLSDKQRGMLALFGREVAPS